jgi:hypothetical protein
MCGSCGYPEDSLIYGFSTGFPDHLGKGVRPIIENFTTYTLLTARRHEHRKASLPVRGMTPPPETVMDDELWSEADEMWLWTDDAQTKSMSTSQGLHPRHPTASAPPPSCSTGSHPK